MERYVFIKVNALRLSDAYKHHQNKSSLVQIMAWHLFGVEPLSEPMLVIINGTLGNIFLLKFESNTQIFIEENEFEHIVFKMAAFLFQPQCVNSAVESYHSLGNCDPILHILRQWQRYVIVCTQYTHHSSPAKGELWDVYCEYWRKTNHVLFNSWLYKFSIVARSLMLCHTYPIALLTYSPHQNITDLT